MNRQKERPYMMRVFVTDAVGSIGSCPIRANQAGMTVTRCEAPSIETRELS
ncbi:MAG: hypothetical protein JWQ86_4250 [Mycobacterium sp.]|nr:hypothetical protein [Mycobacterium sp.]